jgi:hypothetical protein
MHGHVCLRELGVDDVWQYGFDDAADNVSDAEHGVLLGGWTRKVVNPFTA